jgi:transcriptional regulator with XRE-family HTH domain
VLARELLRDARRDAGLTQAEVARRAGVRQPVVAAYEAGRREPTLPMLRKLLRAAGHRVELSLGPAPDVERANERLQAALGLAEAIPVRRRRGELTFPRLP